MAKLPESIEVEINISEKKILEALNKALLKIKNGYKPDASDTSITAWVYNNLEIITTDKK